MPNAKDAKKETVHRILVLGDTGSGKTSQFLTLPGRKFMYCFDSNALLSLQGFDVEYEEFLPDRLSNSVRSLSSGKGDLTRNHQNTTYLEWEKDFEERMDDGYFDQFDVIGLDSGTTLLSLIMDRVLTINGRGGFWPQQDDYAPQMNTFNKIVRNFTSIGKPFYMTGHMEYKTDKATERMFRQPLMTGQLRVRVPLLFSDIFFAEVKNDGKGNMRYTLQTVPDRMTTTIRTSIKGLDPVEDVTIDFSQPLEEQGLGRILQLDREGKL